MFLVLEMETGVMDGWYSDTSYCDDMIKYFTELYPSSRWIIVSSVNKEGNRISNDLFFGRMGTNKLIEKYGNPKKID